MKPSDNLFKLVKSLTKSEKANFRKFAERHIIRGENNYMKLFDEVLAQKVYDEKKIIEKLNDKKLTAQLHVIKNYLFGTILKSLKESYKTNYIDHGLYEKIIFIDILSDKGLHKPALKLLEKTKINASNRQKEYLIFKLLDMEAAHNLSPDISRRTDEVLERIINSKRYYGKHLMLKSELKNLFDRQNHLMKLRSQVRTPADEKKMADIMENPVLNTVNTELSLEGIFYKYVMKIKFYLAKGDMNNYKAAAEELLNEFNKNPVELSNNTTMYYAIALQYLDFCISSGKIPEFEKRLSEYNYILNNSKKERFENRFDSEHRLTFLGIMLKYHNRLEDMEKFISTLDEVDTLLTEFKGIVPPRRELIVTLIISEMVFMNRLYEKSLHWVNKILNYPAHPSREDIYQTAIVLSSMIHYELGNLELMEYTISNTIKRFRKSGRLLETERAIFKFLRKIAYITDTKKLIEECTLMKKKLFVLSNTEGEKTFFSRISAERWISEKLEKLERK